MRRAFFLTLTVLLLVSGELPIKAEQKVFSIPISKNIVRLEVQVPDGHWIKAAVLEGDQLRVEDQSLKVAVALIPVIKDGNLLVRVFRIEKRETGEESMHFIEQIEQGFGETSYTKLTAATFSIRAAGVNEPPQNNFNQPATKNPCKNGGNADFLSKFGGDGPARCCVTCGGTTSCGCGVQDTCGSCCAGICCNI